MISIYSSFAAKKNPARFERGTKFNTEATNCFEIISGSPQNQLRLWMCPGNFDQLDFTIRSYHLDCIIDSVLNLRHLLGFA